MNNLTTDSPKRITPALPANPLEMLSVAVQQGADIDKLEKLMALAERYDAKLAKQAYLEARAKFQSLLKPIERTQEVDYSTAKGRTQYKFASIDDIAQAIKPLLHECGLSYRFEEKHENGVMTVKCIASHVMGHEESNEWSGPIDTTGGKNQIQAIASSSSYLRRYTMTGLFGITSAEPDTDGGRPDITVDDLLAYNKSVRENISSITFIKEALGQDDFSTAVEAWVELGDEVQNGLWKAPTKGGIFTTEEVAKMRSKEWAEASKPT